MVRVGLAPVHAAALLSLLAAPAGGAWPPYAAALIDTLATLAAARDPPAPADPDAEDDRDDDNYPDTLGSPASLPLHNMSRNGSAGNGFPFFVLDGGGGVFVGSDGGWPFENGYAFAAWIWIAPRRGSGDVAAAAVMEGTQHLFRLVCGDTEGQRSGSRGGGGAVAVAVGLRDGRLVVRTRHGSGGDLRATYPFRLQAGQWVHVAVSHGPRLLLRSEVEIWVQVRLPSRNLGFECTSIR